jgi:hypothetical protein
LDVLDAIESKPALVLAWIVSGFSGWLWRGRDGDGVWKCDGWGMAKASW